ncbi:RCC1-like chromosome condensation regulator protein [Chloropicon primus]|uniref:RCC1-like chromosome condensation regulator protein n=1 Tax=Chloropicon primus TaxID=1764295 RepID=A0A5B8MRV5_9CHLO|nr:RCC1-like chromosome condensation regulator protein [Chloropicon primus]UPR02224.1 RCC1-like chromosome condensation regulator protein [Chloropicon primus]|eukprot:QDZ23007.1 RCC1-like chromosome condensation regulator protein [Chloropicon primus]
MVAANPKVLKQEARERKQRVSDHLVEFIIHAGEGEDARKQVERVLSSQSSSSPHSMPSMGEEIREALNTLSRNGTTALHCAVWKNDIELVDLLLSHGANPDVQDRESGWTALHRACYFGHLILVVRLLKAKAKVNLEDRKGRTAFDLLSHEVTPLIETTEGGEVFSWGMGTNFQLGTGCMYEQNMPTPVTAFCLGDDKEEDSSQERVSQVSCAKYHSCAVTTSGQLYTFGFGRGGRLGHEDSHVHSGMHAVLEPRVVRSLLKVKVTMVAAAKHHTVCLAAGDVYTWGSNKDFRLGYTGVDSQPTPRRVASIKANVLSITAANKHSGAVTSSGDLLTWGSNHKGQLGYGTTESASNATPRIVEALKSGVTKASASKNHTIVLLRDGEVWTFGHKITTPQKVAFNSVLPNRSSGEKRIEFHDDHLAIFRPHMVEVAAGTAHSTAISSLGVVYVWNSFDPSLTAWQVRIPGVALSASSAKEMTCVCTECGNVYAFEGKARCQREYEKSVDVSRVRIRRASGVAVGEKHSLAIQKIWYPPLIQSSDRREEVSVVAAEWECQGFADDELNLAWSKMDLTGIPVPSAIERSDEEEEGDEKKPVFIPSLHEMCQSKIAESCVNTRVLCSLIEFAEMYRAFGLKAFCSKMMIANLDVVAAVRGSLQSHISFEEVLSLENILPQARISETKGKVLQLDLGAESRRAGHLVRRLYQRSTTSRIAPAFGGEAMELADPILSIYKKKKKKKKRRNEKDHAQETSVASPIVWADLEDDDFVVEAPPTPPAPAPAPVPAPTPVPAVSKGKPKLRKGLLREFLEGGLESKTSKKPNLMPDEKYNYTKWKLEKECDFPSLAAGPSSRKGKARSAPKSTSLSSIMAEEQKKQREELSRQSLEKNFFGFGGWSPSQSELPDFKRIQQEQLDLWKATKNSLEDVGGSPSGWLIEDKPLPNFQAILDEESTQEQQQVKGPSTPGALETPASTKKKRRRPRKKKNAVGDDAAESFPGPGGNPKGSPKQGKDKGNKKDKGSKPRKKSNGKKDPQLRSKTKVKAAQTANGSNNRATACA